MSEFTKEQIEKVRQIRIFFNGEVVKVYDLKNHDNFGRVENDNKKINKTKRKSS